MANKRDNEWPLLNVTDHSKPKSITRITGQYTVVTPQDPAFVTDWRADTINPIPSHISKQNTHVGLW
jgi:hypothetical protein